LVEWRATLLPTIVKSVKLSSPFSNAAPLLAIPLAALGFQLFGVLLPMSVSLLLLFLASLLVILRRRKFAKCSWLLFACITVVYASWLAELGLSARLSPKMEGENLVLRGFVNAMPQSFEQGIRYRFWVSACSGSDCPLGQTVRLAQYSGFGNKPSAPLPQLGMGRDLCLKVRLKRTLSPLNPYAFDAELRSLEEGIVATGNIRGEVDCKQVASLAGEEQSLRETSAREQFVPRLQAWVELKRTALRDHLKRSLERSSTDDDRINRVAKATIIALVVGEQSAIPNAWWTIFNQTGVGHLMSISGLHITLFAGIALSVFKGLFRLPLCVALVHRCGLQSNRLSWFLAVLAAFTYSLISGWGIPAQRTCWMLAAAAWALNTGRSKRMSQVLALAAAVVTVMDPWAPMAAGFWLSFAAVGALVWCGAREHLSAQAWYASALRSQVAATIALAPMGAAFFGAFSLVGPLANAFAIPFVSSLLTPYVLGFALLSTVWSSAASFFLYPAIVSTRWMLQALEWMAGLSSASMDLMRPTWFVLVIASAACIGLLSPYCSSRRGAKALVTTQKLASPRGVTLAGLRLRNTRYVYLMGLVPLLTAPLEKPLSDELWLTAFDVGQGMAILIETDQRRLLYDAGPTYGSESEAGSRIIAPYLRARGASRIDALIISHQDSDHAGGAKEITKRFLPYWISSSLNEQASLFERKHIPCREGQGWHWGDAHWRFLHPGDTNTTAVKSKTNAKSCVLRLDHPAVSVLLPGDLEAAQERRLVTEYGATLKSGVLIAPHHGSASSSSQAFLDAVQPTWAIFQVGYRNRFKHPSHKVLPRYEELGVRVLRSDHDGAVQMRFKVGQAPVIRRFRVDEPPYWRLQAGP
jgi:competence protein ComEC